MDVKQSRRGLTGYKLVTAMCVCEILCMAGFATFPALLPTLRADWGLDNWQAGLIGGVLFFAYVLAVPILSSWTDRYDARFVYFGSSLVAASGSFLFGFVAEGFWVALAGQALFGAGFAGIFMPGLKLLTDRIPQPMHSRATAFYTALSGIGLGASFALAGWLEAGLGWRWAFFAAGIGPLIAGLVALMCVAPRPPDPAAVNRSLIEGFRLVLRNRPALGFVLGYTAHTWELYGLRSWMVGFLAFAVIYRADELGDAAGWATPTNIAALISLTGLVTSIGTNELAARFSRMQLLASIMIATPLVGIAAALAAPLSLALTVVLVAIYYGLVMSDSAVLTAGVVSSAKPDQRGATMAIYSALGFSAGLFSPVAFGLALDLGGPRLGEPSGWALGFLAIGLPSLLAIGIVRRLVTAKSV